MRDNSFTSILILLVLFIILPSVLKFIGQYTLGSKDTAGKDTRPETDDGVQDHGETMEEYPSGNHAHFHDRQPVDGRPITPKWF